MPSIRVAISEARRTLNRFPAVLLCAFVTFGAGNLVGDAKPIEDVAFAVLAAATLGLPLFVAVALTAERLGSRMMSVLLHALGLAVLLLFGTAWPHWTEVVRLRRYAQLSVALHLLVAFLPCLRRGESNGFWQFNR